MIRINMKMILRRVTITMMSLACAFAYAQMPPGAADAGDDPPLRVGRLATFNGVVSYSPAGDDQWVAAQINRPIVTGDRLWADQDGRAEVSIDNGSWFLGPLTSVTVSNLDDRMTQFQLQQGTLDVSVRQIPAASDIEIDTPNVAFTLQQAGRYRIDVDPNGGSTTVTVRSGSGTVFGESTSYVVTPGQAYRFFGTDLSNSQFLAPPPYDALDQWATERERRFDNAAAARYVSPEVVGYADLDNYGRWDAVAGYGDVWFPSGMAVGWAPYRDGHWAWINPWGWTWVDDAPWGFAPFHYGRWLYANRGWGWIPGPSNVRPYYAPALVAFVGGAGFGVAIASGPAIGWFPLGPREVYRPWYHVSRGYFRNVNVSNTVVNTTVINNYYNNVNVSNVSYVNMRAPNAVTAVPPAAFASSRQVREAAIALPASAIAAARVEPLARIAPSRAAFSGAAPVARAMPPTAVQRRGVVARTAPPPPPVPIARQLPALEKNPGQPIPRAEVQNLRRAAPVATPAIRIVGERPVATPAAQPGGRPVARPPMRAPGEVATPRAAPRVATPPAPRNEFRGGEPGVALPRAPQPRIAPESRPAQEVRTPLPPQARREPRPAPMRAPAEGELRAPGRPEAAAVPHGAPATREPAQARPEGAGQRHVRSLARKRGPSRGPKRAPHRRLKSPKARTRTRRKIPELNRPDVRPQSPAGSTARRFRGRLPDSRCGGGRICAVPAPPLPPPRANRHRRIVADSLRNGHASLQVAVARDPLADAGAPPKSRAAPCHAPATERVLTTVHVPATERPTAIKSADIRWAFPEPVAGAAATMTLS